MISCLHYKLLGAVLTVFPFALVLCRVSCEHIVRWKSLILFIIMLNEVKHPGWGRI